MDNKTCYVCSLEVHSSKCHHGSTEPVCLNCIKFFLRRHSTETSNSDSCECEISTCDKCRYKRCVASGMKKNMLEQLFEGSCDLCKAQDCVLIQKDEQMKICGKCDVRIISAKRRNPTSCSYKCVNYGTGHESMCLYKCEKLKRPKTSSSNASTNTIVCDDVPLVDNAGISKTNEEDELSSMPTTSNFHNPSVDSARLPSVEAIKNELKSVLTTLGGDLSFLEVTTNRNTNEQEYSSMPAPADTSADSVRLPSIEVLWDAIKNNQPINWDSL